LVSSVARSLQAGATRSATIAILIRYVFEVMALGACNHGAVDLALRDSRVRHFAFWLAGEIQELGGTRRSAADNQPIF
jgi:hypothetical protein